MRKHRVIDQPSGATPTDFRDACRIVRWVALAASCTAGFACSAYDNAETPGHALGSGGSGAPSAQGGSDAASGAGGAFVQGGSSALAGTGGATSGLAGSLGQAGTSAGGAGGASAGSGGGSVSGSSGTGGGSSGSGGAGNGTCGAHPLTAVSKWTVTASSSSATDVPARAIDGDLTTRWSSGKDQAGDEWLQVDFSADVTVKKVTLKLGSNMSDFPRTYKTRLTSTPNNLAATPQVMGSGASGVDTVMTFDAATTGRFLLITQGGTATGLWWSVAEISVECSD